MLFGVLYFLRFPFVLLRSFLCPSIVFVSPSTCIFLCSLLFSYAPFCFLMFSYAPLCSLLFSYAPFCSLMLPSVLLCSLMHPYAPFCSLMLPSVLLCSLLFSYVLLCTLMFPSVLLCYFNLTILCCFNLILFRSHQSSYFRILLQFSANSLSFSSLRHSMREAIILVILA